MTDPFSEPLDFSRPTAARVHNRLLGGKDHFAADRAVAAAVLREFPEMRPLLRLHRYWRRQTIRRLTEAGVAQFLDIGPGLPLTDSTGPLARAVRPEAQVVYVEHDPFVLTHLRALLVDDPARTAVVDGDLRAPHDLLTDPDLSRVLDRDRPVAVLLTHVLHHVADTDDPHGAVRLLLEALPTGSFLALSHLVRAAPERTAALVEAYAPLPLFPRSREAVDRFLDGLELVDSGPLTPESGMRSQGWFHGGLGRTLRSGPRSPS